MDRAPNKAPFPLGARLRYRGTLRMSRPDGTPVLYPGIEAVVIDTRPGRRGTLRWIDLDDGEGPIQDTTRDGWSVVEPSAGFRRIARPDEWEPA